jgi:hypothetical protein
MVVKIMVYWAVLPCRLVNEFLHMLLPTCQPNLHSVTFKQTISAISSSCCLTNEVWFFCMTVLKHIREGKKNKQFFFEFCCCFSTIQFMLKLMHNTVRFCAFMNHYDILVICLKTYNIDCNLKTKQWQEKCVFFFREKIGHTVAIRIRYCVKTTKNQFVYLLIFSVI